MFCLLITLVLLLSSACGANDAPSAAEGHAGGSAAAAQSSVPEQKAANTEGQTEYAQEKEPENIQKEESEPYNDGNADPGAHVGSLPCPSANGRLHVEGISLADRNGDPIQLCGISTHGLAWFPQYVNEDCFRYFHDKWGVNLIRLAMYTAESGGYCTNGDPAILLDLIDKGVSYARTADMYVIIDWHVLSDRDPNTYSAQAKDFWNIISAKYAEEEHVLYEICNEPNSGVSWDQILGYAQEVIPVIRSNDKNAVIIIGTPTWSQDVDAAAANPVTISDNLMYALHFYADTHRDDLRNKAETALAAGLPLFVTEFGICDASGNGAINYEQAAAWIDLLDAHNISYAMWNLSNKDETSAMLRTDCSSTSGFKMSDFSDAGLWLYETLTGEKSAGSVSEESAEAGPGQVPSAASMSLPGESDDMIEIISDVTAAVSCVLSNSWESGGRKYYQYTSTVINTSYQQTDSWSFEIRFAEDFTLSDGWNGIYTAEGRSLRIENADYNGTLSPGGSVSDIGFIVSMLP